MYYDGYDYKNPDVLMVLKERARVLGRIRQNPGKHLPTLRAYYKDNPAEFINDWGSTLDPKGVERNLPALVPFVIFPKQREWVEWVYDHWKTQRPGLTDKSRQGGLSWLSVALACTLCLFHDGMSVGFGSRKQEYIDVIGDPKSLIEKGRIFLRNLPTEFRGGWTLRDHSPHMRIIFPQSGALISGEAGDNIGRGNTTSIYFVDEAAFLEHPVMVEASLSQTTNCRIDISTPNGLGNSFAVKRFGGKVDTFTFHWRDDPRKDEEWYRKQCDELDPVTVAAEIDINYSASVEGVLIPSSWVQAALDAHRVLGIAPTGARRASLDVADEGRDLNAFVGVHGSVVERIEEWSGAGADIFGTTQRVFGLCDENGYSGFRYDADGLGSGVRGDARILNEGRPASRRLDVEAFRGSGPVINPDDEVEQARDQPSSPEDLRRRTNQDFFANAKAQAWWSLRTRFQRTYRWIHYGEVSSFDDIISLPKDVPNVMKLVGELSQPTYKIGVTGKIIVDKMPEGARSPNLADALMIRFAPGPYQMKINPAALHQLRMRSGMARMPAYAR